MFELITTLLLVFLAGVGLGTFVLGSRIRKVVAETVVAIKAEEAKIIQKVQDIKKEF